MSRSRRPADPPAEGEGARASLPPVRKQFTISAGADYRLQSAAVHTRKTQSQLIEELIVENLGSYFTSQRKGNAVEVAPEG